MRRQDAIQTGVTIQEHLVASERANDEGLIARAELLATMLRGRLTLGFAANVKAEMIEATGALIAGGIAERRQILSIHTEMAELSERLGIDPRGFGGSGDKDADAITSAPPGQIVQLDDHRGIA